MTRLGAYVGEALAAIWRNRTRSILTMLGMIIGSASIIAVLGISRAAAGGIQATIGSFGSVGIVASVDPTQDDPRRAQIEFRDLPRIAELTAGRIEHLVPNLSATYKLRANGVSYDSAVSSQTDFGTIVDSLKTIEGRRMNRDDVVSAAHVALLSHPLAQRFFGDAPAVGQVIRVGGSRFTIVGVYADFQGSFITSVAGADYIEIPYTTFHQMKPGPMDFLQAFARPGVSFDDGRDSVEHALQVIHGPRSRYVIQDADANIGTFNKVLATLGTALTAIGAVALVVAGIGIMNIMLVSVAERTREIGLRKSIGASRGDIMLQFLLEAVLLSLLGGGIGMLFGIGTVLLAYVPIANFVGPAPIPYVLIVSIGVGFSMLVGCVFGTYPALRASRLDPVVALRS